jgi:hypothetical protein
MMHVASASPVLELNMVLSHAVIELNAPLLGGRCLANPYDGVQLSCRDRGARS